VADRESYRIVNFKDLMFKVAAKEGGVSIERTMNDFRKLEKALQKLFTGCYVPCLPK